MALLPILTCESVWLALANLRPVWTWRQAALQASLIWGTFQPLLAAECRNWVAMRPAA